LPQALTIRAIPFDTPGTGAQGGAMHKTFSVTDTPRAARQVIAVPACIMGLAGRRGHRLPRFECMNAHG
jgi:hypothetical protein